MKKHLARTTALLLFAGMMAGTSSCTTAESAQEGKHPENIIFLIGDGMGLSEVSATLYYGDGPSQFYRFNNIGMIRTSSATHKVTDSAASGTAMSSGYKTYNGAIGMDTTQTPRPHITDVVSALGWSTGVVATASITHATPASFYGNVVMRNMEEDIAAQLPGSEIDFFAGGGIGYFNARADGQDLFPVLAGKGFTVDTTALAAPGTLDPEKKYGFLLAGGGMPPMPAGRGDFLPRATALAIEHLSGNADGFFLMVEGSQIDWAGHANDNEYMITEMNDFNATVKVALDFAEKDGHTLVVVCADHETGGFSLSAAHDENGMDNYAEIEPTYATGGHSATLIPVFAYGPGSAKFRGIYENTEIFHKMAAAAKAGQ
ncbi:MAG: alkaline phosphatase [Bacteroidales bacterium]